MLEFDTVVREAINIGSNYKISVSENAQRIDTFIGAGIEIETDEDWLRLEKSEVNRLWAESYQFAEKLEGGRVIFVL